LRLKVVNKRIIEGIFQHELLNYLKHSILDGGYKKGE
jgi:hypothetical protein